MKFAKFGNGKRQFGGGLKGCLWRRIISINEIKEATGFSASKVVKILVDYAYDNIEWEEE